jgi:hypothetical protein
MSDRSLSICHCSRATRDSRGTGAAILGACGSGPNENLQADEQHPALRLEVKALQDLTAALPGLEHLSFFADGSDDITLSLFFGTERIRRYIGPRLKSFGWRARSETPQEARSFSATSMFISFSDFLRNCNRLGCIVLDCNAEVMGMSAQDLELVLSSLQDRRLEVMQNDGLRYGRSDRGHPALTLMLCGLMSRWRPGDANLGAAQSHPAYIKTRPPSPTLVSWNGHEHCFASFEVEIDSAKMKQSTDSDTQRINILSQGYDRSRLRITSTSESFEANLAEVPYSDQVQFDMTWDARLSMHRKTGIKDHPSTKLGFLGSLTDKMGHVREIFLDRPSIEDDKDCTLVEQMVRKSVPLPSPRAEVKPLKDCSTTTTGKSLPLARSTSGGLPFKS